MAANDGPRFIRVRLYFDYPPPAVVDCRMCWLLVDLGACRVVADLESVIRDKFGFGSRSVLSLFVDDCYLPHTESALVVRDNDGVRVKVDSLPQVNGHSSCPDTSGKNSRKRRRPTEEEREEQEEQEEEEVGPAKVKKRGKKQKEEEEESLGSEVKLAADERKRKEKGKEEKKKRRKEEQSPAAPPKPAASAKKKRPADPPGKTKETPKTQIKKLSVSSSSSSSSSEEDDAPKKKKKPAPKQPPKKSTPKAPPGDKPPPTKSRPASSSSSDSSSSDDAPAVKIPPKNKPLTPTPQQSKTSAAAKSLPPMNCPQKQATPPSGAVEPDGEDEIEFVIRRPTQRPARGVAGRSPWRGGGRGRTSRGAGGDGGGAIAGHVGRSEISYQTDRLSNASVVVQNGEQSGRDYGAMPLLAAPPQVGRTIAFKLLELGESYTPEISGYKEGKIVSFDPTTKQIELELLGAAQAPAEPGKFDLVYQNADGSERVEYAVSRGTWVTERWDSLLEPRLLI